MNELDKIYEAARISDANAVQYYLGLGKFSYRLAQSYCECKGKFAASDFIKKQATCKCGNIVSKWDGGEPKCGGCRFSEAMQCIEYSKPSK